MLTGPRPTMLLSGAPPLTLKRRQGRSRRAHCASRLGRFWITVLANKCGKLVGRSRTPDKATVQTGVRLRFELGAARQSKTQSTQAFGRENRRGVTFEVLNGAFHNTLTITS